MKPKILGIAASLRNARWGIGNQQLVEDLVNCQTEYDLKKYLSEQAEFHLQNFIDAGRDQELSFNEIYRNLQKLRGNCGLSNSEVALSAGLWAASQNDCEIEHISLSEYFPATGASKKIDELKEHLTNADGILLSTPVYFGDRGSLSQELIDLIKNDSDLKSNLQNKVYAGIAVGAKRNGGQETTLVYQLLDIVNLGLLGVGNDSNTTSQYGGTGHAGDVGTMAKDEYGLWTAMGTGRRVAHVTALLKQGQAKDLQKNVRVMFWILQDRNNIALEYVQNLTDEFKEVINSTIIDVTSKYIGRCLACDICPTHIDIDEEYRCVIHKGGRDKMGEIHDSFLFHDAVIPVVYTSQSRNGFNSNYQCFMERTRYLRRGDYVFNDVLTAPLVIEDLGLLDNMHIRMSTSMLRHHTILTEPMVAYRQNEIVINSDQINHKFSQFISRARQITAGRLSSLFEENKAGISKYNPVGYVLSAEKDKEDEKLKARDKIIEHRYTILMADATLRLST